MKLKFKKENDNIKVFISDNITDLNFDYIKMINILYKEKTIEPSIFEGEFLQNEIDSINSFVKEIYEKISRIEVVQQE